MKAQNLKDRPNYELLKQNDIVCSYHLQLPRWLMDDQKYVGISLEGKFVYTLLFNRFQLSKTNGWTNKDGEVFVIYTRKELSEKLNISEKRVSSAMNELKEMNLIWERRCGRGFANQIYLASVALSLEDAVQTKHDPLCPPQGYSDDFRTDEMEVLEETNNTKNEVREAKKAKEIEDARNRILEYEEQEVETEPVDNVENHVDNYKNYVDNTGFVVDNPVDYHVAYGQEMGFEVPYTAIPTQEPPMPPFMNFQNDGFRTDEMEVQEPPKQPPSQIDKKRKILQPTDMRMSTSCPSIGHPPVQEDTWTRPTDAQLLEDIILQADLSFLEPDEAQVIKDAIERLFYSESLKVDNAIYPNNRIRSNLLRIDYNIVQSTLQRYHKNQNKIVNSGAYVTKVLFNTIMESSSDMVLDPYLNFMRNPLNNPKNRHRTEGGDYHA